MSEKELSEEEKILQFVNELFEGRNKDLLQNSQGNYGELFEAQQKKTSAPHEIFINVVFHVISLDAETQNQTTTKMIEENYYVPLPVKEDFNKYIDKFNSSLKKAIVEASNEVS